ncbi:oxidoreductase [Bdellovibrio sp. qaytius]|nr:oxidoreductase [Bdellovibrio sp. qaytius]
MTQVDTSKKIILITGCATGLGKALVEILSQNPNYKLIVTARAHRLELLRTMFQESQDLIIRELDVTVETNIFALVNEIANMWGRIDVLVNNAGICYRSVVEHMDRESEMIQLETNYLGPMALIRSVLPIMREQMSGHIINISSVSGMVSMPTMGSYSASKHALEGASESLWYEAKPYGIKVSLVEPGFINSDSFKNILLPKKAKLSAKLRGPHSEYYLSMSPFVESLMKWAFATPESIAHKIKKLIAQSNPPLRLRVTLDAKVFSILRKLLPEFLFHKVMFLLLPGSRLWGHRSYFGNRVRAKKLNSSSAHA